MSDDLSMLPSDVQEAVSVADQWAATYEHGFAAKNAWATIRPELLHLARENAELHKSALGGYEDGWHALRNERDALKAELAKLRARIAWIPIDQFQCPDYEGDCPGYLYCYRAGREPDGGYRLQVGNGMWLAHRGKEYGVTHVMPFPCLPAVEDEG